jgi:hypothetical protein
MYCFFVFFTSNGQVERPFKILNAFKIILSHSRTKFLWLENCTPYKVLDLKTFKAFAW